MDRSKFLPTSGFAIHQDIFQSEIGLLESYILELTDVFERKSAELHQQYAVDLDDYQLNAWEQEYFKNALDFPKILNPSVLIGMYTIFEKTLKSICDLSEHVFKPQQVPKKTNKTSTIKYYADLLINLYKVSSASSPVLWKELDDYRIIRNVFAHGNGNIRREKADTKQQIIEIVSDSDEQLLTNQQTLDLVINDNQWLIRFSKVMQLYLSPVFHELIEKHMQVIRAERLNQVNKK